MEGAVDLGSAMWSVCDRAPVRTLDTKGRGELPWLVFSILYILSHNSARKVTHKDSTERGQQKLCLWYFPRLTLCIFLLDSFCLILNHEPKNKSKMTY